MSTGAGRGSINASRGLLRSTGDGQDLMGSTDPDRGSISAGQRPSGAARGLPVLVKGLLLLVGIH